MSTNEQQTDATAEPERSLNQVLFVSLGLPEMVASRIMRAHVVDEIITALMREGILTKEGLSRALAEGEKAVQETCQNLQAAHPDSPDMDEAITNMRASAEKVTTRMRDKFIN